MKKKVLFNIAFISALVICVLFLSVFIHNLIQNIGVYNLLLISDQTAPNLSLMKQTKDWIFYWSVYVVLSIVLISFMVFMLIYINKKDITVLSASVVDKMKEQRKQKAEEKKQQKIEALEEQLKQLKKDE